MNATTTHDGIEAVELSPADAADTLAAFSGLALVPIKADDEALRLQRAGFTVPASERSQFRGDVKGGAA